jgi:hypothetical protein
MRGAEEQQITGWMSLLAIVSDKQKGISEFRDDAIDHPLIDRGSL